MFKKCYRCGKLLLFFKVNEYGRCKECEKIAKEEQWKNEIKEQKANEQKKNNRYIKPAPNYNTPVPDNVNTQPPTNYSFHRNSVDAEIMLLLCDRAKVNIDTSATPKEPFDSEKGVKNCSRITDDVKYGDFVAFDIETTGLSPFSSKIIELSAVRFRNSEAKEVFSTLVNPQVHIPPKITKITGINDEIVKNAPTIEQVIDSFIEFIGNDPLVGHNIIDFDLPFLYQCGFNPKKPKRNYYDTLKISRRYIDKDDVDNFKLDALLEYYDIQRDTAHRGDIDSCAEGLLFVKLLDEID